MKNNLIAILFILFIGVIGGAFLKKCPTPQTTTTYVYDTIWKTINKDIHHYHYSVDTLYDIDSIFIVEPIDTMAILKDYFRVYAVTREWNDSTIEINILDTITQNKIKGSALKYKYLKPTTIIKNNNINNYINLNIESDAYINYYSINADYIGDHYSIGVGYFPKQEMLTFRVGINLLKFK